ncbi:hypothetical protein [Promicromonospora sp. NPDC023805]|uniref:hypothetical protein n=1 Tax=Promicromonospora sp. NPDC023805 TaxID=3154696 RepID=UPI0033FCD4C0
MTTNDRTITVADYAAGLRALADFLEAAGLPASVRFPTLPLGIQLTVTSADAVKDYALTHDLPVTGRRHTKTVVALGPNPDTYYDGSIELTVVYVPDEAEDAAAEEPEATGVDTYDCPEPNCDYSVSAVGTPDPDEPDEFAEDIEQHKRGHAPPLGGTPSLVQLDQADAGHRVIAEALAFDELDDRRDGLDVAGVDAWDTAREGLRQALADFREVTR